MTLQEDPEELIKVGTFVDSMACKILELVLNVNLGLNYGVKPFDLRALIFYKVQS